MGKKDALSFKQEIYLLIYKVLKILHCQFHVHLDLKRSQKPEDFQFCFLEDCAFSSSHNCSRSSPALLIFLLTGFLPLSSALIWRPQYGHGSQETNRNAKRVEGSFVFTIVYSILNKIRKLHL